MVRTPEFSQCFGDKAALEELTDGTWGGVEVRWLGGALAARGGGDCCDSTGDVHCPCARDTCLILSFRPSFPCAADLLTAIEFDHTGDYLATGDRGGRVVLFEKGDDIKLVRVASACVRACASGLVCGVWCGWLLAA